MNWRGRLGIRSKILWSSMISILLFIFSMLLINNQINELKKERNYIISHDFQVQELSNRIEKDVLDMETGQRGFIITGDPAYLEPYNAGIANWKMNIQKLRLLLEQQPGLQQKLDEIGTLIESWSAAAGEPLIQLRKENKTGQIQEFFRTDPGKKEMDQIRTHLSDFREAGLDLTTQRAAELNARNHKLETIIYVLIAFVCAAALLSSFYISNSIVRTIQDVTASIRRITAAGNSQRITVRTQDEVGELGIATNELLDKAAEYNWLQSNIAETAALLQGITDSKALGQAFLGNIAPLLNASYGVVYFRSDKDHSHYLKLASYASGAGDIGVSSIRAGEGLTGQCITDNRMMYLDTVPPDYIRISSALGQAAPKQLMIYPLVHDYQVLGALELASFAPFTASHRELLAEVVKIAAIALHRIETRMEIERLLEESQMMTEELQVQTEELQAQAEELQAQAEELETQQDLLLSVNSRLEEQVRYSEQKAGELERSREELVAYSKQLEEVSAYKSTFLANMSHELRTPLNSMLVLSQILSENKKGRLSKEEQEYARVVHSAGNDLLGLINDILDLSKVEAGKIELAVDQVNLMELPQLMKYQFGPIAEQKRIQFTIEQADDVPSVIRTDEQRLHQILKNLMSNAFKFTERGEVRLSVAKATKEFCLQNGLPEEISGQAVAISVCDTGIGIPDSKLDLIFEAFQQADGATSRKYGGTGLGLSISREFAALLGGSLHVVSAEGKGSTFTLILPVNAEEIQEKGASAPVYEEIAAALETPLPEASSVVQDGMMDFKSELLENEIFKGKKVLIVDDDIRNTFALTVALEQAGVEVTVAENGEECLDLLQGKDSYDLVLMDIMMPVMDGYETMRRIRKMPEWSELPMIALTAKAMKYDREKCLEAGASDYISKPLNMDQLLSMMLVWLVKQE
ncbi:CHASE3 domain-containing protein [Paenibacillus gansuensis]|uniref:histidine kinase n=1 Tax=Paenibacillus gansuensis TaxID=306542 RepID=A0ABW5PHU3_9BACL